MKILSLRNIFLLSIALIPSFPFLAEDSAAPSLKVEPIGRIHVDGALYLPKNSEFKPGAALPEIRVGARAFYGDWMARIEIGYAYSRLSMKDVYIQRNVGKENFFRLGYFIPQFGIRGGGSASYKPALIQQIPESFFRTTARKIGIDFRHFSSEGFISAAAFVGGRSLTLSPNVQGRASVGGSFRGVWHPNISTGKIFQVGLSTSYETASNNRVLEGGDETIYEFRNYSANFPTAVNTVAMMSASVDEAIGDWKISPELVLSKDRFALESQFYYMRVERHNNIPAFNAKGAFAMARFLLAGDSKYAYDTKDGALALPSPKSLELVAGYSFTDGNDSEADIYGGIANDFNLTLNYYINKYMIARLRYSYTDVRSSEVAPRHNENIIQARLQFVF